MTSSSVPIPDEAIRATYGDPLTESVTNRTTRRILELGAPYIDRAARIDELKQEIKHHQRITPGRLHQPGLEVQRLRKRIAELEAQDG